jgi:nucleotide-binding universal stress UspA family protein
MTSSASYQGIIAAVDGSPSSSVATDWAAREAAQRQVSLTLVHVAPEPEVDMWPDPLFLGGFWDWREKHGHQILNDARRIADNAMGGFDPIVVEQETHVGGVTLTLTDLSKDAVMIVVGRRGLGAVKRRLLGSVSSGLVHHAHCPVAVIHDEDPLMSHPAQAPVVVGIDGSPASELATAIAFDEASRRRVGLIAIHSWASDAVYTWAGIDWSAQCADGERALAEQLAGWQERYPDVSVERKLVFGDPAEHLVAASELAQLTVVGSHGRGGFAGMLLGSVSSAVVQAARMPVIVARQG